MFHSKFVEKIRQTPLQNTAEKEEPCIRRYIGIENTDLPQRIQHTIRNLLELDEEELSYIEDMNCKNMFEIVKLLNHVVATLVENITAID